MIEQSSSTFGHRGETDACDNQDDSQIPWVDLGLKNTECPSLKFNVTFWSGNTFTKKVTLAFTIKNFSEELFSKTLSSGQ